MKSEAATVQRRIAKLESKLAAARAYLASLEDEDGGAVTPRAVRSRPSASPVDTQDFSSASGYGQNVQAVQAVIPPAPETWTIDDLISKMVTPLPRNVVMDAINGLVKRNVVIRKERGYNNKPAKFQRTAA